MRQIAPKHGLTLSYLMGPVPGAPAAQYVLLMKQRWDDPLLFVSSDDRRTFRYRLQQSWYRETVLNAAPAWRASAKRNLGSLLDANELRFRPGLNFLNEAASVHAQDRIAAVHHAGGTLEAERLRTNMLSSMPMCFNLFGALRDHPEFLELVRATLDPEATAIVRVDCEWAPVPADALGDKTAFDAVVVTARADGSRHLVGVECKYTEPFSATRYNTERYSAVHDGSGWFKDGTAQSLIGSSTNQLWRNTLLAVACATRGHADTAAVAVVALAEDPKASRAVNDVRAILKEPELHCRAVPLESFVSAARDIGGVLNVWANQFERRYLDLSPIGGVEQHVFAQLHASSPIREAEPPASAQSSR